MSGLSNKGGKTCLYECVCKRGKLYKTEERVALRKQGLNETTSLYELFGKRGNVDMNI